MATVTAQRPRRPRERARRILRENGLSLVLFGAFLLLLAGQAVAGVRELNIERAEHGSPPLTLSEYIATGDFMEATAENWESEFLQMAAYILLTVSLLQKGSSESRKLEGTEAIDRDPRTVRGQALADAPWPVRRGGWVLRLYENSLSLAFLLLFSLSFVAHAAGGARSYSDDQVAHGGMPVGVMEYLQMPRFWFESLQNWQSEFLAIAAMVVLSIHLRQRGSPESKPVAAPHSHTGSG